MNSQIFTGMNTLIRSPRCKMSYDEWLLAVDHCEEKLGRKLTSQELDSFLRDAVVVLKSSEEELPPAQRRQRTAFVPGEDPLEMTQVARSAAEPRGAWQGRTADELESDALALGLAVAGCAAIPAIALLIKAVW